MNSRIRDKVVLDDCIMPECVVPDREELEKAVEDAWRDYDIAYIALMAYYKENT